VLALELESLARSLGSRLAEWVRPGTGDAGATFRVGLVDGRTLAGRRISGPTARTSAERLAASMRRVRAAGLPVPEPRVHASGDVTWLCTEWVVGDSGAAWLDTPARARHLASRMGAMVASLRLVDTGGLDLAGRPGATDSRADSLCRHLASLDDAVSPTGRSAIQEAIAILGRRTPTGAVLSHGDFAPINVIVDTAGEIRAILDWEHAAIASPLDDVAWWGWIVRHHHPVSWLEAWPTMCEESRIEVDHDAPIMRMLAMATLIERAATSGDASDRARWIQHLEEAAAW
jgi:aminoglycoside phosphotransferase (APT) family kinase protein